MTYEGMDDGREAGAERGAGRSSAAVVDRGVELRQKPSVGDGLDLNRFAK